MSGTKPEVVTAAISGWQASDYRGQNVLDNIKYVKLVQYFSSILEFKMPRSFRDNNDPSLPEHVGRFFACHVVRRIMASRLLLRPRDTITLTHLPGEEAGRLLDHCRLESCAGHNRSPSGTRAEKSRDLRGVEVGMDLLGPHPVCERKYMLEIGPGR